MLRGDVLAQLIFAKRIAIISGTIEVTGELYTDPQSRPYSIAEPPVICPNGGSVLIKSDHIADNASIAAA